MGDGGRLLLLLVMADYVSLSPAHLQRRTHSRERSMPFDASSLERSRADISGLSAIISSARASLRSAFGCMPGLPTSPDFRNSLQEVAALTGLSRQTVTRLFEHEKGVLIVERPETMHKKKHRTIRIPRAVYERVRRRITVS